jgi:chemotaxis protein CheX
MVTSQLLGMTDAELDEAGDEPVNDAVGELTNMTVGSFKNGLCDAGYPCMLTIPSILRGSNFCVEPISSAQRHIFRFDCAGHRVVTDILMKTGE